jgi:hypothetical protein
VTGATISASAVIVVFRYGFGFGEGSSTAAQPAACILDKQKAAIASYATDLTKLYGFCLRQAKTDLPGKIAKLFGVQPAPSELVCNADST